MTDDVRWRAVQERDARLDGEFVYAVRSTGIYCRPSCPARRPERGRVVFFTGPDAAEAAGFRPCRRCQPREASGVAADLVRRACRWIEEHSDEPVRLAALGVELAVSPGHLQRTFKHALGVTPREYAESCRLARLKAKLRDGDDVTTALYGAGYGSSSRLYEQAPTRLGMTPNAYRRGGLGMRVSYTIVDCPLGRLLVAATERGVCAIALASADAPLEDFLRSELPSAELRLDDAETGKWVRTLLAHLEGRQAQLDVPVDVGGTDFQRRVWEALRLIPYGSTRSYGEVARSIGQPTATRAVARACATNPVPIVVPCHRVIRGDGALGGYRWGIERKRALLEGERAHTA